MSALNGQPDISVTAPFLPVYNGPEDPDNHIGFIRANHDGRIEAFDTGEVPLGAFANDNEAAEATWSDCLEPQLRVAERPIALKPRLESMPHELKEISNWVLWRYEPPKNPDGKWRKVPYQPNGYKASTTSRRTWSRFETCRAIYERGGYDGIGFVFDGEVGPDGTCLVGIDLDRCMDLTKSKIKNFALERIKRLGTYTEASPSGTGLHLIARTEPVESVKTKEVEIYTTARYFTFTGRRWDEESPIRTATAEVRALIAELKPAADTPHQPSAPAGMKIAQAFRHLKVEPLAEGIVYDKTPLPFEPAIKEGCAWLREAHETGGRAFDNPQWALTILAAVFLVDGHTLAHKFGNQHPDYTAEETEEKWDEKIRAHERGVGWPSCKAIAAAGSEHCKSCPHFAVAKSPINLAAANHDSPAARERRARQIAENIEIGDDVTESLLPQIMTLKEMHERLVFVGSNGAVADIATKRVRKKEHAFDEYAASKHTYITEKDGKIKQEGGPALKYWIASKDRITVEVLAWVPGAGVICPPPEGQGPAFNMWRGLNPMAFPEDWQEQVQPFLEHIDYLVPNEQERERFLQWLAHIVQHPEVLPHTSYLMITPVTGIGRNWMASVLVRALRGYVAAGVSLPVLLDKGYTGRLSQKLLIIVDEAREGRGERRYERAERFKQLQTEEHRDINHKYGYQVVEKNCGRWLGFSNHWDAIPLDSTDRRDIVIANPTVRKPDAYYERLYGLLNDKDFIGSVRHWLETRDIDAFRPGEHAPMNPAKLRALDEMMSETERAAVEFREDCKTELTSRDAIKSHVNASSARLDVNDAHLTHAIRRAGMVNTGRRIMAYKKHDNNHVAEKRFQVVIVRGEWDTEIIKKADPGKLLVAMGLGDWSPWKPS